MPLTYVKSNGIADGTIVNADINASAAIAYSKLNLATSIVNADINASAAIATTKLGTGAVLQVITATDSTQRSTTSSTLVTGSNTLSISITPSSTSNKIFVIVTTVGGQNTANRSAKFALYRDSTLINYFQCNDTANLLYYPICISNLDSPSTTSAVTYQLYFATDGIGTNYINYATSKGSITAMEIKG